MQKEKGKYKDGFFKKIFYQKCKIFLLIKMIFIEYVFFNVESQGFDNFDEGGIIGGKYKNLGEK